MTQNHQTIMDTGNISQLAKYDPFKTNIELNAMTENEPKRQYKTASLH